MRDAATAAIESGAECIVVPEEAGDAIGSLARVRLLQEREGELLEEGRRVGSVRRIDSRDDVEAAIGLMAKGRTVLLETPDWTVIPLEDLVAARHGEGLTGRALALVATADEGRLALGALEHGVDGVVLRPDDPADVKPAMAALRQATSGGIQLTLTVGTVVRVEELGLGDRACVDTVDILREGEGLLVGSSSGCFLLVHGETIENPYAAVRPFRVNAGAVHSYVLGPGGRTLYLSEAASGIRVLLVDREGLGRPSHVGRLKIERRPLVLVEVEAGGQRANAILQNAETVRLVTPAGHASVSGLEVGQKVIVYQPSPMTRDEEGGTTGRHFGRAVPERIIEG
ncbi:MAG: 3-dehydroquinate synthase II [Thermoplasmata archaeon]|nr:MAG: 3-dehydroquinate synthase II [Thermoplasmata archaeon]